MLNHIYIYKAKYDFYLLRDLAKCTLNKIHFYFIFWKWEFVFRNFGDFDEKWGILMSDQHLTRQVYSSNIK
jgi:hypothetical protein